MEYTANLHLKKPQYTDFSDVVDLNDNMDTLDAAVSRKGVVNSVCGKTGASIDLLPSDVKIVYSSTEPATPVEGMIWIVPAS